jgi:membrane protein
MNHMWRQPGKLLDHALFGPHTLQQNPLAQLLRLLRYPYALIRDLLGGELSLRATGLVYTTLLALIPLIALSFALLKTFGAHRDLEPFLLEFFRPVGEAGPQIVHRLMELAESVSGGLVGMVGFALLLWTLIGTVNRIEDSLNFVWRVQRARSMPRRVMEFAALVTIGPLVVAAVIAFSKLAFDSVASYRPENFTLGAQIMRQLIRVAPYALMTILFTAIYVLIPNTRVRPLPALAGGLLAGILWAATGKAFTAMVIYTSSLTLVYAGFAVVIAVFLWTYVSWLILLAGAQLAFYVQNPDYLRLGHAQLRLSGNEQERLALDIMARVASEHRAGNAPWTLEKLGRSLALPGIAVAGMAEHLERAGLLAQADDGKLFPGREITSIPLSEIIHAARTRRTGHEPQPRLSAPGVLQLQADLEQAWRRACGTRTLDDLIATELQNT